MTNRDTHGRFCGGRTRDIDERFWEKVESEDSIFPENGCMLWMASKNRGYGQFGVGKKHDRPDLAHRWIYQRLRGPIPDGFELDHLCRVRHCVNPDHLEVVTRKVNLDRSDITTAALGRKRTHCSKGHEFTPENTYFYGPTKRQKQCLICKRNNR